LTWPALQQIPFAFTSLGRQQIPLTFTWPAGQQMVPPWQVVLNGQQSRTADVQPSE
jgi:hypothetical protein